MVCITIRGPFVRPVTAEEKGESRSVWWVLVGRRAALTDLKAPFGTSAKICETSAEESGDGKGWPRGS